MTDAPDSYSQAELVRLVRAVQHSVDTLREELRDDIRRQEAQYVSHSEWETWRVGHDRETKSIREDVAEAKSAAAPIRVSPWIVAGFAVSAVVGAGSLITLAVTLIRSM